MRNGLVVFWFWLYLLELPCELEFWVVEVFCLEKVFGLFWKFMVVVSVRGLWVEELVVDEIV